MTTIIRLIFIIYCLRTNIIADDEDFDQYPELTLSELKSAYDFIIVGAGSAGCTLANRLSEIADWNVLLIEASGREKFSMDIPGLVYYNQRTPFDWTYLTEPSKRFALALDNHQLSFPRGKVMGGSSVTNFMIYTRGNPKDYDGWQLPGWSWNDIEKYFLKLENYNVPDTETTFGNDGPMYIGVVPYQSKLSHQIVKANQEYGLPLLNINGPKMVGVSKLQTTVKNGVRWSTNRGYLVPIRNSRPNLHLIRNCQVTKVLFTTGSKPKATGVQFMCSGGNTSTILAQKEVILSAGAINSPQILMLSGIGHNKHLTKLGIPVIKDLPVGDNLQDHINVFGLQFLVNETTFPKLDYGLYEKNHSGPLSIPGFVEVYSFSHTTGNEVPLIEQLFISSLPNELICNNYNLRKEVYEEVFKPVENSTGFLLFPILQRPKSHGKVRLRDANPLSKPKIFPNYLSHPDDLRLLIVGIKEAINIAKQPSLQEMGCTLYDKPIPQCAKHKYGTDNYWECHIRAVPFTLYHQSCTCKMGKIDDPTAVVDPELKVIGISGLRVIDASVMPNIITGHLNGPTIMIAEKASDLIKKEWNK